VSTNAILAMGKKAKPPKKPAASPGATLGFGVKGNAVRYQ